MRLLIFNGSPDAYSLSTSRRIVDYLTEKLREKNFSVKEFHMAEADIPFLNLENEEVPPQVMQMCEAFTEADIHIWLSPLYHGAIPGTMKNCLDWLEITNKLPKPYLSDKLVGLICWADGVQAMQGINNMDAIAKALRAWVMPYSIPIVRGNLYDPETNDLHPAYLSRFDIMADIINDTASRFLK